MAFDSLQPPDNFLPAVPNAYGDVQNRIAATNALALQQQQMAQHQAFIADLHALPQNPTPNDIAGLLQRNPTQAAAIKSIYDTLAPIEQQAKLKILSPIHAAMLSGAGDVVASRINDAATAYDNANRPQDAQELRGLGDLYAKNPRAAITTTGAGVASLMGPEKYAENFAALTKLPADLRTGEASAKTAEAKADNAAMYETGQAMKSQYDATKAQSDAQAAPQLNAAAIRSANAKATSEEATAGLAGQKALADLNNVNSEIAARGATTNLAAKKFGLEQALNDAQIRKLNQEAGDLPPELQKQQNEYSNTYNQAMAQAKIADDLAAKIPKILKGFAASGAPATVDEVLKAASGGGDKATLLRKQLTQFINQDMLSQLPAGAARSPEMMATIKAGFPKSTDSADVLLEYLKNAGSLKRQVAATASFKKNYLGMNRSPGQARNGFVINGIQVNPGEDPDEILQTKVLPTATGRAPAAAPSGSPAPSGPSMNVNPDRVAAIKKTMTPAQIAARRAEIAALKKAATS